MTDKGLEYVFRFPKVDGESIRTSGETYGEAADKAIAIRTEHVTPLKADGELYKKEASLTSPVGPAHGGNK